MHAAYSNPINPLGFLTKNQTIKNKTLTLGLETIDKRHFSVHHCLTTLGYMFCFLINYEEKYIKKRFYLFLFLVFKSHIKPHH